MAECSLSLFHPVTICGAKNVINWEINFLQLNIESIGHLFSAKILTVHSIDGKQ